MYFPVRVIDEVIGPPATPEDLDATETGTESLQPARTSVAKAATAWMPLRIWECDMTGFVVFDVKLFIVTGPCCNRVI
ncbi:MAG: hypothetical protein OSA97_15530, partial [Nevskia sp.]|nr:hypothetical protein [Nevskia sp.]